MDLQDDIVACICEGSAEKAIINILLDNKLLKFSRENLLDECVLTCRNAKTFEQRYLNKRFSNKITIFRILDSRRENFKLSPAYKEKVSVINIITAPEIEMLIILCENKYNDFKKSRLSPSSYCKQKLQLKNVKKYDFVEKYFSDVNKLIYAIKEYKRISNIPSNEKCLYDLLK